MSATTQSPGTPFRTVASALCNGGAGNTAVAIVSGTGFSAIARTVGQAAGSYDLTFANPNPAPTGKVIVKITSDHLAGHNLSSDYVWVDPSTLRVTFRIDDATLTDAPHFGVTVRRMTN